MISRVTSTKIQRLDTDFGDSRLLVGLTRCGRTLPIAGLLIGIAVLKNIVEKPWERMVWWLALVFYGLLFCTAVIFNAAYRHYPETDWSPCCSKVVD